MAHYHDTKTAWRVIQCGRTWQVQNFVDNEHGRSWWDIGHPRDDFDSAVQFMNTRAA